MKNSPPAVEVKPQFHRSVRLDVDFDRDDALLGYILQSCPRQALHVVAEHVNAAQQRAFTWTGPYGAGKSSLALALAQLAGGSPTARKLAKQVLAVEAGDPIHNAFGGRKPWLVLPVVGRRESVERAIGEAIDGFARSPGRKPSKNGRRDVIAELLRRAESNEHGGVLLILDELGKFLEAAAANDEDIFFYQELAEAAGRANGRLVVIGILHQAFEQYAKRTGREVQAEWAKIQGRFVDIPIVAGTDEVIELIGSALTCHRRHPESAPIAKTIATAIRQRRPSSPSSLATSLDRCWPLHPVTAALLGPSSRRKFGQNERSVFSFLASAEPLGFREFLAAHHGSEHLEYFSPAHYWDYLRANFEPSILSSPDGHRWAICSDAVERTEARFNEPHVSLVKTTGLIELFRNGSGVAADTDVLSSCVPQAARKKVEAALADLAQASILIYRKHLQAWGVYAGSDFDIEAAVTKAVQKNEAAIEDQLRTLAVLPRLPARRHYAESGTLRLFEREVLLAESARSRISARGNTRGVGRFVLLLPSSQHSEQDTHDLAKSLSQESPEAMQVFGVPKGKLALVELAQELLALTHVAETQLSLEGDPVAQREIHARLRAVRAELESMLRDAFGNARWYFRGEKHDVDLSLGLSSLASEICDMVFHAAPVVHSELVNRDVLSSNSAKAQRLLLHRMITHGSQPNLGFEGFPAEAGVYFTTLVELGLHESDGNYAHFVAPKKNNKRKSAADNLCLLWETICASLKRATGPITLEEIYEIARRAPFGIKEGLLPIFALAFFLTHRSEIGLYVEGTFVPELTDAGVDEWLQDPKRIAWRWVHVDVHTRELLERLASRLERESGRHVSADPLDSARALVSLVLSLPEWTHRTQRLTELAKKVRDVLLRASDPVKVIFIDLPEILGAGSDPTTLIEALGGVVDELKNAYPRELEAVRRRMLTAIDHSGDLSSLRSRAEIVQGISGDYKLDAFASRLTLATEDLSHIEGLISLVASRPPKEFTDHDLDAAIIHLSRLALEFRRVEALAAVRGRASGRRAFAVVFGGEGTVSGSFDVAMEDNAAVRALARELVGRITSGQLRREVLLAALAEAGTQVLSLENEGGE